MRDGLVANKQIGALEGTIARTQWTERSRLWECFLVIPFHNKMLKKITKQTRSLVSLP